jgi:hypothetical protein
METNENIEKKGMGHFMLLLVGFIAALVAVSFLVIELFK